MKYILPLIFLVNTAVAQEWTKQVVLSTGDTVRLGDKIRIMEDKTLSDIYPRPETGNYKKDAYKIYLTTDVPGKTFKITRISRIRKNKGGYTPTVSFNYYNERMDRWNSAEYIVNIENALKSGQVTLVK